tara:strand:- start:231 stop:446 length:216 start_codon:yes stop_codon:yes gene_type:complete
MNYYFRNKEARLNYQKNYYKLNIEKYKIHNRLYYKLNKNKIQEKRKNKNLHKKIKNPLFSIEYKIIIIHFN